MRNVRIQPYLTIALVLLILALAGRRPGNSDGRVEIVHDTVEVVRIDTFTQTKPGPVRVVTVETSIARLPLAQVPASETCVTECNDSADVLIPIEEKVYEDSAYRAVITGYMAELKEIQVYQRTTTRTVTNTVIRRNGRWGIGIQAGVGLTPYKPQPYIGVGISYNFITF